MAKKHHSIEELKAMEAAVRVHSFIYCCKCLEVVRSDGSARMRIVASALERGFEFRDCQWFCPTHKKGGS